MTRGRDGLLALCLFALLSSVYLLTFSGVYHSSDEMSMLAVTDSLARRGAWDIELLRWMGEQQGSYGSDGHLYSRKGIGTTLAALPFYWLAVQWQRVGNVQAAMLTNGIVTALTGALVYLLLRRLQYRPGVSLAVALAFGLGTMAWPYARYLFSESLAGLGLIVSAYFLICYGRPDPRATQANAASRSPVVERPEAGLRGENWNYPLLAGAGLGIALLARLNNALVAPFLGLLLLAYLYRRHRRDWRAYVGPLVLFALPLLAALATAGWYNWLRFGSPLATGYLPEERFATPFFEGFYGLTFSPGKGLFWYNPLLLAALVAWPAFFRRYRAEALLVAAVVLSNCAFYASWYLWWAGHAWGPRFLVTILPFAVLPLAPALETAVCRTAGRPSAGRMLRIGLGVLAAVSVAVQLLGVAVDFNLYLEDAHAELGLYHPSTLFNPAYSPLLRQGAYLSLETLDLAWARGGSIAWLPLLEAVLLTMVSGLALWATWRKRPYLWAGKGLPALLALGTVFSLINYTPTGDVAVAANDLAVMERPGEAAALTAPLLTEAFQDAYDGRLWVWGVPSRAQVRAGQKTTWTVGAGDPEPAAARVQLGIVRLDWYPPPGQPFDTTRLPAAPVEEQTSLGGAVELDALLIEKRQVYRGETLELRLYWRALTAMDTSYTVFVQLVDREGVKAAQVDHLPCNGGCPTDTWRPGDLVGQWYELSIHPDAPSGTCVLIAGMYDLATGERLPVLDAQGNVVSDYLELGTVQVQP